MKAGEWAADPASRGSGRLQARKLANGELAFYYRYAGPGGERVRLPLGIGLSLAEARTRAAELSRRYQNGERDLRHALLTEQREAERERLNASAAEAAEAARARATLGALLDAYVAELRRAGKSSARSVERCLRLHVETAWPKLWTTPASDVSDDDLLAVVARLAEQDKLREAAKLRAYLRAAYAAAVRARQNARALPALRDLKIAHNPARDLAPIEGAAEARERALSVAELRGYWKRIRVLPDPDGALLRFHLLTGGQRVEQLARLTTEDIDQDAHTVRLRDGKGRRRLPRLHDVPLLPEAQAALQAMQGGSMGPFLFTVTGGASGAVYATVQHRLRSIVEAMMEAGELEKGPFTVGDLRRTVETRLAAAGVSLDVRAQLQSHGLGGIQARHYDRHDYLMEKRAALEALHRVATGSTASVTPIKRRAKK
ncbi:MAG: tyrosine-type recombinase/integrase [Dokdonella sp.]|nr:tyrosine-type recombinase/integrase [Dokdonella sp.]